MIIKNADVYTEEGKFEKKDVYVEGATPTMGSQVVCLDEYDTEIDVSELSVDTIIGTNNIISDCNGDVTASYKVSIQKYIDDNV